MIIAVDAGKYATKAMTRDAQGKLHRFYVRTKTDEVDGEAIIGNQTYVVERKNKQYLIGEDAIKSDYQTTKTKLPHKLATLLAISNFISDDRYEDVNLFLGCPLITFCNPAERERYKQYILEDSRADIKVNNIRKRFNISNVMILPESLGVPYQNINENASLILQVIDIGGLNTSGAVYQRLKPVRSTFFSINEGANILMNKIKRELNKQLCMNYQDFEMENVIKGIGGEPRLQHKINDIILCMVKEHIERIMEEPPKYNWNIGAGPIYFTGGGSKLLEKQIKAILPNAVVSQNAVWDNVAAFHKVGELLNGYH